VFEASLISITDFVDKNFSATDGKSNAEVPLLYFSDDAPER
jgi:hypothetical protein